MSNNNTILSLSSLSLCIIIIIGAIAAWYFLYYKKNQEEPDNMPTLTTEPDNSNIPIITTSSGNSSSSLVPANTSQLISSNKDLSIESNLTDVKSTASPAEIKKAEDAFSAEYIKSLNLTQPIQQTKTDAYLGLAKVVAANVIISQATEKLGKAALKIGRKSASKVAFKVGTKTATVATKGIAKMAAKKGINAVTKLGIKSMAKNLALGPFGPAAMVFDVLSMGLDQWDPANYNDLEIGTRKHFRDLKNNSEFEIRKTLEESGLFYPAVVGPFDKLYKELGDEKFNNLLMGKVSEIMDIGKSPLHPLMQPFQNAFINDYASGKITDADLENEEVLFSKYENLIDSTKIFNEAYKMLCVEKDGKFIIRQNEQTKELSPQCSYKDRASCENSYKWTPSVGLPEDNQDLYAEFRTELLGGSCINYNFAIRQNCEDVGLKYDTAKGDCVVTKEFCNSKGAEWEFNKDLQEFDCFINNTQQLAEVIFGRTITRGVKQGAIAAYNEVDKLLGGGLTAAFDGIDKAFGPFNPITGGFKLTEIGLGYAKDAGEAVWNEAEKYGKDVYAAVQTGNPVEILKKATPVGRVGDALGIW